MKKIIFIIFIALAFITCNKKEVPNIKFEALLSINKTDLGYNIYSNEGELILEFTKRNCDSLSLETLDYIHQTAKEFYYKGQIRSDKKIHSIKLSGVNNE